MGGRIDVISCGGSELTWFQCWENWLGFVSGSKTTWFRIWMETNLIFVSGGMQNWRVFRVEIECNLSSVLGPKLAWFCVGDRNRLASSARIEIDVFCTGVKIDLVFFVRVEYHWFLAWARKFTWFGWRDRKTWFECGESNLTWFQCKDGLDLVVVCVVEIDLFFERGAIITCF